MTARLREARRALREKLRREPGFLGLGLDEDALGRPILVVLVEAARCRARTLAPEACHGFAVRIEVVGKARKLEPARKLVPVRKPAQARRTSR